MQEQESGAPQDDTTSDSSAEESSQSEPAQDEPAEGGSGDTTDSDSGGPVAERVTATITYQAYCRDEVLEVGPVRETKDKAQDDVEAHAKKTGHVVYAQTYVSDKRPA